MSGACPVDAFSASSTQCRAAADVCDVPEVRDIVIESVIDDLLAQCFRFRFRSSVVARRRAALLMRSLQLPCNVAPPRCRVTWQSL